jgi:PHD/YefM family antitoxin component YafN of YafNO toxin-antitoxin module
MIDLTYTATEARSDLFNLLRIVEAGKRRVVVKNRNRRFQVILLDEEIPKKVSWEDVMGDGSKETRKAMKLVEKVMKMTDKMPARGTPQW